MVENLQRQVFIANPQRITLQLTTIHTRQNFKT